MASSPNLHWDLGTAYDMFVSLNVLHEPSNYGVRGVWAAGMRSRLPNTERDFLEEVVGKVVGVPLNWSYRLPPPKDAATALRQLEKLTPEERLPELSDHCCDDDDPIGELLMQVAESGSYTDGDVSQYRELAAKHYKKGKKPASKEVRAQLDWWVRPDEFGERYLKALTAYYEVFFAEEERRIYPALQDALEEAQQMSDDMSVADLVEELSKGITWEKPLLTQNLTLAPSFWCAPLIYYNELEAEHMLILFGARPDDASLIPGEVVPDTLVRGLKALSDPTRLKIMHYLARESLTPTQLAHRLRLRAPTVVHHLQTLRVAGLVQVTIAEGKEKSYAMRTGSVMSTCDVLHRFLGIPEEEHTG